MPAKVGKNIPCDEREMSTAPVVLSSKATPARPREQTCTVAGFNWK